MSVKEERRALSRLIDEFDAEVLAWVTLDPDLPPRQRAIDRSRVALQVDDCTACGLCEHRSISDPIGPQYPSLSGKVDLTILTEAPSDLKGRWARLVSRATTAVVSADRTAWVSVVGCVPRHPEGAYRPASNVERTACEHNLRTGLAAAGSNHILIVGEKAMKAWRSDLRMEAARGRIGTWDHRYWVAVVDHPASLATAHEHRDWVDHTAKVVRELMEAQVGNGPRRCMTVDCMSPFYGYDNDALPWCEHHIKAIAPKRPREFTDVSLW